MGTFIPAVALLGRAAADTPQSTLSCTDTLLAGQTLTLTTVVEGALSSSGTGATTPGQANVSPGGLLNLVPNSNDIPNSALGSGATVLNGPDTGLGTATILPSLFTAAAGAVITMSATIPLSLTGATSSSSETLTLSGSLQVPNPAPSGTLVSLMTGSASGSITAGQSGTVTLSVPQFTASNPLTITVGTVLNGQSLPSTLTCTSSGPQTIDTATISSSGTSAPTTTTTTTTTTVPATTTTTAPTTTTTAAPSTQAAALTPGSSGSGGSSTGSSSGGSSTTASTLAFTGAGPDVWLLAFAGLILLDIGYLILTLYYRPRQLLALLLRRRGGRRT